MGAIACHKALGVSFKYAPTPKNEPGAFGVFGLLIVYLVVLTVGIIEDFSIEKFESAMNVAAIAGFAALCAAFWRSSRRNGTDADVGHHAVSPVSDRDMNTTGRWGPAPTIGFLNE